MIPQDVTTIWVVVGVLSLFFSLRLLSTVCPHCGEWSGWTSSRCPRCWRNIDYPPSDYRRIE